MILIVYFFFILVFIIMGLWIFIPAFYGLPPVPTRPERIRKALKLANLQPTETLYDLGAGDGRVLLIAAREFGARAVGIEVGPIQCAWIWLRAAASGFGKQIQVHWENFYDVKLKDADVVFVYATSTEVMKLAPHLNLAMKRGSRLVSISADFSEWEPSIVDNQSLIFVYEMPPARGNITSYMMKQAK